MGEMIAQHALVGNQLVSSQIINAAQKRRSQ